MLVMGVFTVALADEERRLVPKDMMKQLRREAVTWLMSGAIFLVSATPVFDTLLLGGTSVRTDLWLGAFLIIFVGSLTGKRRAPPSLRNL